MILIEFFIFGGMKWVVDFCILSEYFLFDFLGFRIVLELGICSDFFQNIILEDIVELKEIVWLGIVFENNEYVFISEFIFYVKFYEIIGNVIICEFQEIIYFVMVFVKDKFKELFEFINIEIKEWGELVIYVDFFGFLEKYDEVGYRKVFEKYFVVYKIFMKCRIVNE